MRLLERKPDGGLVFYESTNKDVPAYAILSHTWLANHNEEVSFQDVEAGTGKSKAGWKKIQFCADKATADGLRYFWIDTCCINKKNSTELSKAINSMFRWYQKAARCYVYLTDVSAYDGKETPQQVLFYWEATFRKSRWFTRGWTL
jgi:Heterokaryon incompatibility protein (HET)